MKILSTRISDQKLRSLINLGRQGISLRTTTDDIVLCVRTLAYDFSRLNLMAAGINGRTATKIVEVIRYVERALKTFEDYPLAYSGAYRKGYRSHSASLSALWSRNTAQLEQLEGETGLQPA